MRTFSILLSCMFLIGCAGGNVETPVSPAAEGVVSINFDDGFESAFVNGMPIIDAAGLKTTQFIITQKLGLESYISSGQMFAMQANGHEIAAHTRTHPHLSTLTDAQQHDKIASTRSAFEGRATSRNFWANRPQKSGSPPPHLSLAASFRACSSRIILS